MSKVLETLLIAGGQRPHNVDVMDGASTWESGGHPVALQSVSQCYPGAGHGQKVLNEVSLSVSGDFTAITGESGSGKTC